MKSNASVVFIPIAYQCNSRYSYRTMLAVAGWVLIAATLSAQTLEIRETTFDAGTITSGTPITKEFVVNNTGSSPLHISDVKPACGCMKAKFDKTIPPGGAGKVILTVDTKMFQSAIVKTAVVVSNDTAKPAVTLTVMSNVRGIVWTEPAGPVRIQAIPGQTGTAEITLVSKDPAFSPVVENTTEPYLRAVVVPLETPGKWSLTVTSEGTAPVGPLAGRVALTTGIPAQPEFYVAISGLIANSDQLGSAAPSRKSGEPTLTNDEVVKLVAAELGDEIVVAKIKNAAIVKLDLTTDALLALKADKVSNAVIKAMIERAAEPNRTVVAPQRSVAAAAPATVAANPCAGIELMGLYKNEIFDRAMGGGVVEWLAKIRNNSSTTKIVIFGWRGAEGQDLKAQVQIVGGGIASPRLDLTQARLIAPVANLRVLSCE
jgi:hypothetical protein